MNVVIAGTRTEKLDQTGWLPQAVVGCQFSLSLPLCLMMKILFMGREICIQALTTRGNLTQGLWKTQHCFQVESPQSTRIKKPWSLYSKGEKMKKDVLLYINYLFWSEVFYISTSNLTEFCPFKLHFYC